MASSAGSRSKKKLDSLKRLDADVKEIVEVSGVVHVYELTHQKVWQNTGIEGPVYIVKRSTFPVFKLIVYDQKGKHVQDDISVTWEVDIPDGPDPYYFYKMDDGMIRGLWFSDDSDGKERTKIAAKVEQCFAELRQLETEQVSFQALQPGIVEMAGPGVDQKVAVAKEPQSMEAPVMVSSATLAPTFHALADDKFFIAAIMDKLRAAQQVSYDGDNL
eukprot:TRINITY_DN24522_c0_g1_i1.p1 TRINITY_DN24522_c0_g1~~TRINITY_DN24522_c0_g1_i1.p1  ORF type:complete len:217 (-),score=43.34 TRINITY_DN24522_c0_g1_i1:69-719(-)